MTYTNISINGDCEVELEKIPDKSYQLICIDPPYNISKADWDSWGKVKKGYIQKDPDLTSEYYEWLGRIFAILDKKLKDNGTLVFFHNDFRMMAQLDLQVQKNSSLTFRNFVVWNKLFSGSKHHGFLNGYVQVTGLNCFQKMAEYMIFYVKDNSWKLKEARNRLGIKTDTISKEILSKTGGVTGWYNNIETGKNYPTEKTIVPITKYLGLTIDDIVPKFRNQKTHHSIWNYDIVKGKSGHITEKPLEVLENIIKHTTDVGDLCLDCFAGSGSFGVACRNLKRNYTLIEKNEEYMKIIKGKGL